MRKAFRHILIHDCFFPISCVLTSGPPSWKERAGSCFSFTFCLSGWPPHLPQCQSTSVSVALVSTLATVSVHFCLCRLGLHTCHNVSPQRPRVSQSLSVRLYRRHHWRKAYIVNGYRRHSQNSCSHLLPVPFTGVKSESSGEHVSPVTATTSSRASLSELNVTVHVLFSASTRPSGQLAGTGAKVTDLASLRLVD